MKSRTSHILFSYWNEVRGTRLAPCRFEIEPSRVSEILAETFILEREASGRYPFRLAGTRICDHYGFELRGRNFIDLGGDAGRAALEETLATVTEQGAVGSLEFEAADPTGRTVRFEAIVLPLIHVRQTVTRYLGAISAIDPPVWLGSEILKPRPLAHHAVLWPDGRPHAVLARNNRQAPFLPEMAGARLVRFNRRLFRVLDGGRKSRRGEEIAE